MGLRNRLLVLAAPVLVAGVATYEGLPKDMRDYEDRLPGRPVPTACYGHTEGARVGTLRSKRECDDLLRFDLTYVYGPAVLGMVNVEITQGQYNALTDFAYNLGTARLRDSTLLRKLNAGDSAGAQAEFMRWTFSGGKDCKFKSNRCYGIVERRQWEQKQFVSVEATPTK